MINMSMYRQMLNGGSPLGNIRKNNADFLMNATFTDDVAYKKVRVLTRNGQELYDAKYQYHLSQSISKDIVDQYLQFRPGVEFPVGTYVIIPDDKNTNPHTWEQEKDWFSVSNTDLHESTGERTQLWLIVNRNSNNQFVRYNILQCNWNFQWMYNNKVQSCIGMLRDAKSYTSGIWNAVYGVQLDNITSAILPDIFTVYGKHFADLGLDDPRTITHSIRFMTTNNYLNPECYMVSKVNNITPMGLIQLTMKQDEYNNQRDNAALRICDYYSANRDTTIDVPTNDKTTTTDILVGDSINDLVKLSDIMTLPLGGIKYISVDKQVDYHYIDWNVKLQDASADDKHPNEYYEKMIKFEDMKVGTCLKVAKAGSLVGKKFTISATDATATFHASFELEVIGNAT